MRPQLHRARLLGLAAAGLAAAGGGGVAMAASTHAAAPAATALGVKHNAQLGSILETGSRHLTLYAFTADRGGASHCSGSCLKAWPALTTTAKRPQLSGGIQSRLVSSISRGKGVRQLTYAGHPLYEFAGDTGAGTAAGQGDDSFGGHWYVIGAAGREITTVPRGGTPTTSSPASSAPAATATAPDTTAAPAPAATTASTATPAPTTPAATTTSASSPSTTTNDTTTTSASPVEWS